jgi:hypothetical protein
MLNNDTNRAMLGERAKLAARQIGPESSVVQSRRHGRPATRAAQPRTPDEQALVFLPTPLDEQVANESSGDEDPGMGR